MPSISISRPVSAQTTVEETLEAGSSVVRVAMKHGVNANQAFKWRRLHEAGRLGTRAAREVQLLPVRVHLNRCTPILGGRLSEPHGHRDGPDQGLRWIHK
jgi:transposase-like protein